MKKLALSLLLVASATGVTSCGSLGGGSFGSLLQNGTSTQSPQQNLGTGTALVEGLLGSLLSGSKSVTQENVVGSWKFVSPDCVFESENLLAKAGGEVAAQKVEAQLSEALTKAGVKAGNTSFTFKADGTYSAVVGKQSINGNYTLDEKNHTMTLTYLGGLARMTPKVAMVGGKLSLLFEAEKLLSLLEKVSAISGNTKLKTVSSLLSAYDGLYIGLQLKK